MKRRKAISLGAAWLASAAAASSLPAKRTFAEELDTYAPETVPGSVIFHVPARSGRYVGSPGIVILPDGSYLAKCDLFGPRSNEYFKATSLVFRSNDRGKNWEQAAAIKGLFWASIFLHLENVYLFGTTRTMGYTVIMRSDDGGRTWTTPHDPGSGLLIKDWSHTAPVPVVVHNGRIWRGVELTNGPFPWNRLFSALMMSAPVDADLLLADSWTRSNELRFNPQWLRGISPICDWPQMWLEGNAVVTPEGEMVDILRIDQCGETELAAVAKISADGREASFDPDGGIIEFPGGAKKFTIRFDPVSGRYWSLVNLALEKYKGVEPLYKLRNTQALASSADLRDWKVGRIILHHPEVKKHAFQYLDWAFEGDDIVAVSRTAYDDGMGGAHNYHDANFLTFHRIEDFRKDG